MLKRKKTKRILHAFSHCFFFFVVLTLSARLLTSLPRTLFVVFDCVSYSIVTVATTTRLKYDGADVDNDE
jgi:hypothetical protein